MPLTKQQAFPLYFLLVTESSLIWNIRAAQCATRADFLAALQTEITKLDKSVLLDATDDATLGNLYSNQNPVTKQTLIDQDPLTVLSSLPVLHDLYGGGPCPSELTEQQPVWDALKALP